jgi:hypothetical protein
MTCSAEDPGDLNGSHNSRGLPMAFTVEVTLMIYLFIETGSCYVVQAGLELMGSIDLLASASQVAVTTGVPHHNWHLLVFFGMGSSACSTEDSSSFHHQVPQTSLLQI